MVRCVGMKEISGDIPLSLVQKLGYLGVNFVRNLFGIRFPGKTAFWHVRVNDTSTDSPGRSYLNTFVRRMLPMILPVGAVSVLDIGCGTAYMRSILSNAGYAGEYVGVDIVREPKLDEKSTPAFSMTFVQQDINTFESSRRFDLVFSNTSLEHVPNDFVAVQKAHELSADNGVEVHIVPSHWSLPLYIWHGYRQYTPARLKRMFSDTPHTIYRLGGFASWCVHFFCITVPERIFGMSSFRKGALYPKMKRWANMADRFLPFGSALYAIIVTHGNNS